MELVANLMPRNLPRYIHEFIDRHGRVRRYFRYRGKSTPIPYRPGNASFEAAYAEMLAKYGLEDRRSAAVPKSGFIYFVRDAFGNIKIGFSSAPDCRIATLQTGHATPLQLLLLIPGSLRDERALHGRFGHLRQAGEWFRADQELLAHISAAREAAA